MPVIAITGNIAGGKSTVAGMLRARGAVTFDADRVVHGYYRDPACAVYKQLVKAFPQVFNKGRVSRVRLRKLVFSDNKKLEILEKIVHPPVINDLTRWAKKNKAVKGVFVAEVPLLFEKNLERHFDKTIVVAARGSIAGKRMVNKFDAGTRRRLLKHKFQMPLREKIRKGDYIIKNNSTLAALKKEVSLLWHELTGRAV